MSDPSLPSDSPNAEKANATHESAASKEASQNEADTNQANTPKESTTSGEAATKDAASVREGHQTPEPPITRSHIIGVVIVALTLSAVTIIPGILADYFTAQYLKPNPSGRKHPNDTRWKDLIRRRGVSLVFKGKHGTLLQGWMIRPRRAHKRLVFFLHDFSRDHRDGYDLIQQLLRNGLNVFVFDMRAHGKSQGRIGRNPRLIAYDLRQALSYLRRISPKAWNMPAATIGVGMGGSAALLAATIDRNLSNVIAINPTLNVETQIEHGLKGYPKFLVSLTKKRIERVASMNFRMNSIVKFPQRLNNSSVMLLGRSHPAEQKAFKKFCSKSRGHCSFASIDSTKPMQWWKKMSAKRKDALMVFLLKRFGISIAKFRLRARPRIKTKRYRRRRHKARTIRKVQNKPKARTKRRVQAKPKARTTRKVQNKPKARTKRKVQAKPKVRNRPRSQRGKKRGIPSRRSVLLRRAPRRVRHLRPRVRRKQGRLLRPTLQVAKPSIRSLVLQPTVKRKTLPPSAPTSRPVQKRR